MSASIPIQPTSALAVQPTAPTAPSSFPSRSSPSLDHSPIPRLPTEIHLLIIEQVLQLYKHEKSGEESKGKGKGNDTSFEGVGDSIHGSERSRWALALVCRNWNSLSTPLLYRHISLSSPRAYRLVSSLLLDPVKGPLVVSSVKRAYLREMPNDPLADPDAKVILSSLRDLEVLKIRFRSTLDEPTAPAGGETTTTATSVNLPAGPIPTSTVEELASVAEQAGQSYQASPVQPGASSSTTSHLLAASMTSRAVHLRTVVANGRAALATANLAASTHPLAQDSLPIEPAAQAPSPATPPSLDPSPPSAPVLPLASTSNASSSVPSSVLADLPLIPANLPPLTVISQPNPASAGPPPSLPLSSSSFSKLLWLHFPNLNPKVYHQHRLGTLSLPSLGQNWPRLRQISSELMFCLSHPHPGLKSFPTVGLRSHHITISLAGDPTRLYRLPRFLARLLASRHTKFFRASVRCATSRQASVVFAALAEDEKLLTLGMIKWAGEQAEEKEEARSGAEHGGTGSEGGSEGDEQERSGGGGEGGGGKRKKKVGKGKEKGKSKGKRERKVNEWDGKSDGREEVVWIEVGYPKRSEEGNENSKSSWVMQRVGVRAFGVE